MSFRSQNYHFACMGIYLQIRLYWLQKTETIRKKWSPHSNPNNTIYLSPV